MRAFTLSAILARMHVIVQVLGAITFIAGLIVAGGAVVGGLNHALPYQSVALIVASAVGTLLSGALLYCFGAMVEHLAAIRKAVERQ